MAGSVRGNLPFWPSSVASGGATQHAGVAVWVRDGAPGPAGSDPSPPAPLLL